MLKRVSFQFKNILTQFFPPNSPQLCFLNKAKLYNIVPLSAHAHPIRVVPQFKGKVTSDQPVDATNHTQCTSDDQQQEELESISKNPVEESVSVPTPTASEADFIMLENNFMTQVVGQQEEEEEKKQEPEEVIKSLELNGDGSSPRKLPVECEDLLDLLEDEQEPDNLNEQEDEDSTSVRMTEDEESTISSLPVAATITTTTKTGGGTVVEQTVVVNQIDSM